MPWAPRWSTPPEMMPAPMPVPTFTKTRSSTSGRWACRSPSAMMFTSLSIRTGTSNAALDVRRDVVPVPAGHDRRVDRPPRGVLDGAGQADADRGEVGDRPRCRCRAARRSPARPSRGRPSGRSRRRGRRGPRRGRRRTRSARAARACVAPMSTPTTTRALGLKAISDGGRPPVETPSPIGITRPSRMSTSTRAVMVDRARPVGGGQLGAGARPPVPEEVEDVAGPHGRKSKHSRLGNVQQTTFACRSTKVRDACHSDAVLSEQTTRSVGSGADASEVVLGRTGMSKQLPRQPASSPTSTSSCCAGAGPRRGGRERRRQVDPDEDPRRRAPARRRHHPRSAARRSRSATRSRRSRRACRRSSRSSTCCRSGRSPRTSTSAASRVAAGSSTPRQMNRDTEELLADLGVSGLRPTQRVRSLSVAEQQIVEIAKAVSYDARIISMDEPTAALADHEVELLYTIVREPHRPRDGDHLRLPPAQGDLRPLRHDHRAQGRPPGHHRAGRRARRRRPWSG